jgi:hypothetical protein
VSQINFKTQNLDSKYSDAYLVLLLFKKMEGNKGLNKHMGFERRLYKRRHNLKFDKSIRIHYNDKYE